MNLLPHQLHYCAQEDTVLVCMDIGFQFQSIVQFE